MNMLSLAASKHGDLSIDIWLFARGLGTGNIDIDWGWSEIWGLEQDFGQKTSGFDRNMIPQI
jgi:hypothetical protein